MSRLPTITLGICIALLLAACQPAGRGTQGTGLSTAGGAPTAMAPKHLVAVVLNDPASLYPPLNPPGSSRGVEALTDLVNPTLAIVNSRASLVPQLAEAVPSVEAGSWTVLPDGRMETTWRIRPGVKWHDGAVLSADDLVFTVGVGQDRDLPEFGNIAYDSVESVRALDPQSVVVTWKRPYIHANTMFTRTLAAPLPRHILEKPYLETKESFSQLAYWNLDYVGGGPYRLEAWDRGSHLTLVANDAYVPGRPKIDKLVVRFIPDTNTVVANVLAGEVDVTLGKTVSQEQALQVKDLWRDGRIDIALANALQIHPQFVNPNPAIVLDVQFRRALYHATDRQQLVDALLPGQSSLAHSWLSPNDPTEYQAADKSVIRYSYDPQRAARLIEELGFQRGQDGIFRNAATTRLSVEVRTPAVDVNEKAVLALADYWQRVGVATEPVVIPPQLGQDLPYRSNFPAFEMVRGASDMDSLGQLRSRAARLPQNNYRGSGGTNYARYMNAEFDALIDRFFTTIPMPERISVGGEILAHMTEQLIVMPLFYDTEPTLINNRVANISARNLRSSNAWNAHEWDVTR